MVFQSKACGTKLYPSSFFLLWSFLKLWPTLIFFWLTKMKKIIITNNGLKSKEMANSSKHYKNVSWSVILSGSKLIKMSESMELFFLAINSMSTKLKQFWKDKWNKNTLFWTWSKIKTILISILFSSQVAKSYTELQMFLSVESAKTALFVSKTKRFSHFQHK
jgi:hypothetical protein